MRDEDLMIANSDVLEVTMEVPEGHRHLRTTLRLREGGTLTLQEATVANLVRAYTTLKTHPLKNRVRLTGAQTPDRKSGFAEWQLLED